MLHRSFKPAKCKTALNLAKSRLKLLKNKKEVQLKQLKRDVAKLLESGQDQTARIRVEHVVREEKTIAAYELLEIYCELIAARLSIIESQKNCPIDLKEAITSVVFASPRCADIPELQDVRKHFTGKYGKEFISAAVELRPECGVSRMIIEKLSANAPDGPTKIKILSGIAEEHNIKWDPKSFGEKELKPHEDLLNGPNTFEKASRMQTQQSIVQPQPSMVQAPPTFEQKHNAPVNVERNARPSSISENFRSTDSSGDEAAMPTPHSGVRPSGTRSGRTEVRHSYSGDGNSFPSDRKNWNMEFKDATAAAQAAAESAERASMAARAAADLSSRGQYNTESYKSNIRSSRDEGVKKNDHDDPDEDVRKFYGDGHGSTKRSSQSGSLRSSRSGSIDVDKAMKDFLKGARYSEKSLFEEEAVKTEKRAGFSGNNVRKQSSGSDAEILSSGQGGMQTDSFNYFAEESIRKQNSSVSFHSNAEGDRHSRNNSEEAVKAETSTGFSGRDMNKQSIGSGAEFFSSRQGGMQPDSFNYFAEETIRKKNSSVSSHSHSSSHGDDFDVSPFSHPKYESDGGEDPFDHGNIPRDNAQTNSFTSAAVVFDEPVSDDDHGIMLDAPKFDSHKSDLYPTFIESPRLPVNTDTWSQGHNTSGSFKRFPLVPHVFVEGHSPPKFDESSTKSAKPDEFLPLTFDESDGPSSESEDEVDNSRVGQKTDPSSLPQKENIFSRTPDHIQRESLNKSTGSFVTEKGYSVSNKKDELNFSSDDESVEVNKQGIEFGAQARRKFGFDEEPIRQSSAKNMTSEPFYNQVEERKNRLSPQTSRLSLDNEVTASKNTVTPESSDNMKDKFLQESSLESGNELKFGMLTGGLRHKGYIVPPYTKSSSRDALSSKKAVEESATSIENSPSFPSVKSVRSGVSAKVENKSGSGTTIADYESDSDDSEEGLPKQILRSKREPYSQKSSKELDYKSISRAPVEYLDSDDNDSEEDIPKQTFNSTGRVGSGFSRRTKASPSFGRTSHSKSTVGSEPNFETDARETPSRSSYPSETPLDLRYQTGKSVHWKSPPEPRAENQSTSKPKPESSISRSSYPSETPPNPRSQTEDSGNWGRSPPEPRAATQSIFSRPISESKMFMQKEDPKSSGIERPPTRQDNLKSSAEQATSKPMPESYISRRKDKLNSSAFQQPSIRQENLQSSAKQAIPKPMSESSLSTRKENPKSSAMEQAPSPLRTVKSASTDNPRSSTLSGELPSGESSLKKASHVHPKLPDYDTIAAQFQSLRSNR